MLSGCLIFSVLNSFDQLVPWSSSSDLNKSITRIFDDSVIYTFITFWDMIDLVGNRKLEEEVKGDDFKRIDFRCS